MLLCVCYDVVLCRILSVVMCCFVVIGIVQVLCCPEYLFLACCYVVARGVSVIAVQLLRCSELFLTHCFVISMFEMAEMGSISDTFEICI